MEHTSPDSLRLPLGYFPTPLAYLPNLSAEFGSEIYMKRDDFTGFNLFGGNKIRKLEYLLGDAASRGCDTVITYGATQSNHVMETVSAAGRCGIKAIVYVVSLVEPDPDDLRANLLLDYIFGAEVHVIPANGRTLSEATAESRALAAERMAELEAAGHKCCEIPTGGATPIGSYGYMRGYFELTDQLQAIGKTADYLFAAVGTGGTFAGLAAGHAAAADRTQLIGIAVSPKQPVFWQTLAGLTNDVLRIAGIDKTVAAEELRVDTGYYGPGYEIPFPPANDDIRLLASREGILTDPVYSGKAFHGMLEYLREDRVPQGSTVVFLHTGGTTALFAEKEILGDLVPAGAL